MAETSKQYMPASNVLHGMKALLEGTSVVPMR